MFAGGPGRESPDWSPWVELCMFGTPVDVPGNAAIQIIPFNEPTQENLACIHVGGVQFMVTMEMLMQEDEPHLRNNYFARHCRFHDGDDAAGDRNTEFHIMPGDVLGDHPDRHEILCPLMYPVLLDFLRRRRDDATARVHIHALDEAWGAKLAILEDFFYPDMHLELPPVVTRFNGNRTSAIAIPPMQPFEPTGLVGWYTADMCMDPAFIRLVLAFKPYDADNDEDNPYDDIRAFPEREITDAERAAIFARPEHQAVMAKYPDLTPEDVMRTVLHRVDPSEHIVITSDRVAGPPAGRKLTLSMPRTVWIV